MPYERIDLGERGYIAAPLADVGALRSNGVINVRQRYSNTLSIRHLFPVRTDKMCATGCGEPLRGRQRRWCSESCSRAAGWAFAIVQSDTPLIRWFLMTLHGRKCACCSERAGTDVDHIHEIADGGGGLWLDNFQLLCHECHVKKTNASRRARKNRRLGTPELEGLK